MTERRGIGLLPMVGRGAELAALSRALDTAGRGAGTAVFVAGDGGIGKTRLARALADTAERGGWTVAVGRAYPVETGVPYALFADALLPILRGLDPATLAVLSRGGEAELASLFPALGLRVDPRGARGDAQDAKARLLWNFSQFLGRLAAKRPLLIVLENLQWADAASLELLHFTARQLRERPILLVCSYNVAERPANGTLATAERSLVGLGAATVLTLDPLSRAELDELLTRVFGVDPTAVREFASQLYDRTRGNPFFIEETLKSLVDSGRLRRLDDRWAGWDITELEMPGSVRDAVIARVGRLSADARSLADVAAVLGTRASYEVLEAVGGVSGNALVGAIDELRRERILVEAEADGAVVYDFAHPTLQATLYAELGRARVRLLHGRIAAALERLRGAAADAHADELAFHFSRADTREDVPKAARYLALAGCRALETYANREAIQYLSAALDLYDRMSTGTAAEERGATDGPEGGFAGAIEALARARQRTGEYDAARLLWLRARSLVGDDDPARVAALERRLGLASFWSGRHGDALAHYEKGLDAAARAGDDRMAARIRLATAAALQGTGRPNEVRRELEHALSVSERVRDDGILARVHRALMFLELWLGNAGDARAHGARAIEFSVASHERGVEWSAHWGIAVLAGLTGNADALARHVREAERLVEATRSPVLRVWTNEVSIEYASGIGDWDTGLALAERTIPIAREVAQRTLLPRLLVWTGLMHLGRGELERARAFFEESWSLSQAESSSDGALDVNTAVPAHTGLAAYALTTRDWHRAVEVGERGVALADRSGYVAWSIHRLIPIIIEAALWLQDFERAERYGARLRRDSARMGHKLGLAWATASDALVARLRDNDMARAIELLRAAADQLDAVPFAFDAARIRSNLAQLLTAAGDRDGAMRELRRAHDVFARIGAERELRGARDQLRHLGARPPARVTIEGAGSLTGREREIARLVAVRKSNKEIGSALGISARTVSTHLSNIFAKLGVGSRGELTDLVRTDASFSG